MAAEAQVRCDDGHRLAVTAELQHHGLRRGPDRRGPIGRLLQERPRRMYVGEGAASKCAGARDVGCPAGGAKRLEQAIAGGWVPRGVVDPPVVVGERPPATGGRPARAGPPGDRRGRGLEPLTPRGGAGAVLPQSVEASVPEYGRSPYGGWPTIGIPPRM